MYFSITFIQNLGSRTGQQRVNMVPMHVMRAYGEVYVEIHKESSNIINSKVFQKQQSLSCHHITTTPTSNLPSSIFLKPMLLHMSCQESKFSPKKSHARGTNARFFGNVLLVCNITFCYIISTMSFLRIITNTLLKQKFSKSCDMIMRNI